MPSKPKSNWAAKRYLPPLEKQQLVDDSRYDKTQPVVPNIHLFDAEPVTDRMLRYPTTLVVRIPAGRYPIWFLPYVPGLRRLQTSLAENYGFVTESYSAFGPDAYVTNSPGDRHFMRRAIIDAAKAAGWHASPWSNDAPMNRVDLYPKD